MLNFTSNFRALLADAGSLGSVGNVFLDRLQRGLENPTTFNVTIFGRFSDLSIYATLRSRGYLRFDPFPLFQFELLDPNPFGFTTSEQIKDARVIDGDTLYLMRALYNAYQDTGSEVVLCDQDFLSVWEFTQDQLLSATLDAVSLTQYIRAISIASGQRINQLRVNFTSKALAFNASALSEPQIKQLLSDRLISPTVYAFMALQFDGVRQVVPAGFYSKWGITPSALLAAIATLNENRFIQSFEGGTVNLSYPGNVVIPAMANPVLNQTGQLYQRLGRVESIQTNGFMGLQPSVLFRSLNQLQNAGLIAFQAGEIRLTWADFAIPSNAPTSSPAAPAAPPVVPVAPPVVPPVGRSAVDLVFSNFGDENDVFYWLGSNGKTVPWSNPYPDEIGIMVSPPLNSGGWVNGQPAALSDRSNQGVPTSTDNIPDGFILIDLGANRLLRLTDICLQQRNDFGLGLVRGINLSGSHDGATFVPILVGEAVNTGQNEWSRHAVAVQASYRYFRLTQSGANSHGNNSFQQYYLTIGEIALYGQLT